MAKSPKNKNVNEYPTNLGFSKSITPSLGLFKTFDSKNKGDIKLLNVVESTSVGTISNYKDIIKDSGKNVEQPNLQTTDSCYAPMNHDSVRMEFSVAFCCNSKRPHACNQLWFIQKIKEFTQQYDDIGGYEYLADLYLKNIFGAKMLWRNGFADDIDVCVTAARTNIGIVKCTESDSYQQLVERVALALKDETKRVVLDVVIDGWIGRGQEIYPSQEFVEKTTDKNAKSKTLARTEIDGNENVAAMHSQKIGNAVRQIDTWYDGFDLNKKALAIDPACVDKSQMKAYRLKDTERDLFTLLDTKLEEFCSNIKNQKIDQVDRDVHFIVANLIRGGVFGGIK